MSEKAQKKTQVLPEIGFTLGRIFQKLRCDGKPGVTGLGSGGLPAGFVHVDSHAFMNGAVFFRKIVIFPAGRMV